MKNTGNLCNRMYCTIYVLYTRIFRPSFFFVIFTHKLFGSSSRPRPDATATTAFTQPPGVTRYLILRSARWRRRRRRLVNESWLDVTISFEYALWFGYNFCVGTAYVKRKIINSYYAVRGRALRSA